MDESVHSIKKSRFDVLLIICIFFISSLFKKKVILVIDQNMSIYPVYIQSEEFEN